MQWVRLDALVSLDLNVFDAICLFVIYKHSQTANIVLQDSNFNTWSRENVKALGMITDIKNDDIIKEIGRSKTGINGTLRRLADKKLIERVLYGHIEGDFNKTYSHCRLIRINEAVRNVFREDT